MLTTFIVALCVAQGGGSLSEHAAWQAYQERVSDAYQIEVSWTLEYRHTRFSRVNPNEAPAKTERFKMLKLKPSNFLLEKEGEYRYVWKGEEGIVLDLKAKTYEMVKTAPEFKDAFWLMIPDTPGLPTKKTMYFRADEDRTITGREYRVLTAKNYMIDRSSTHMVLLDAETNMLMFFVSNFHGLSHGSGHYTSAVTHFDVTPLLISSDFSLKPPEGFKEKESGAHLAFLGQAS